MEYIKIILAAMVAFVQLPIILFGGAAAFLWWGLSFGFIVCSQFVSAYTQWAERQLLKI